MKVNTIHLQKLYSVNSLIKLFMKETGYIVDDTFVTEFWKWFDQNVSQKKSTPKTLPEWDELLIEKANQYIVLHG